MIHFSIFGFLLLSAIAAAGLIGAGMLEGLATIDELSRFSDLISLATEISNSVHELQRERACSGAFVGGGLGFTGRLSEQRAVTDLSLLPLTARLDTLLARSAPGQFAEALAAARKSLEGLSSERRMIETLSENPTGALAWYADIIAGELKLVSIIADFTRSEGLSGRLSALSCYMQAKERAGQERAVGSAGFATGKLDLPQLRRFQWTCAEQDSFLRLFLEHAEQPLRDYARETVSGPAVEEVVRLRRIAIESYSTGDMGGVTPEQWVDASTARIDLFHIVEKRIIQDLVEACRSELRSARSASKRRGLLVLLLIAFGCACIALA